MGNIVTTDLFQNDTIIHLNHLEQDKFRISNMPRDCGPSYRICSNNSCGNDSSAANAVPHKGDIWSTSWQRLSHMKRRVLQSSWEGLSGDVFPAWGITRRLINLSLYERLPTVHTARVDEVTIWIWFRQPQPNTPRLHTFTNVVLRGLSLKSEIAHALAFLMKQII